MFICYCTVAPYDVTITFGNDTVTSVTVEYGDSLILNCNNSGGPNNMFRWLKDDFFEGTTDNILIINAVTADDGGTYHCFVNNTAGESSANITIYGTYVCYLSLNTLHVE